MFAKYKDRFSACGHVNMGEPRHRFSQLSQFGDMGDDKIADEFHTVSRRKRQRTKTTKKVFLPTRLPPPLI